MEDILLDEPAWRLPLAELIRDLVAEKYESDGVVM